MKLKPIEPGCLAVVINSIAGNNGKVVTVGNYIGEVKDFIDKDLWEVDITLNTKRVKSGEKGSAKLCSEKKLLRIDGEDFSHEDEEILEKERE